MRQIIVTGACGGIGRAVVQKLLDSGYLVSAVDFNYEQLDAQYGNNKNVSTHACDLSDENNIKALIQDIVAKNGPVRGLIHCAGLNKFVQLHMIKQKNIEEIFKIHVYAGMIMSSILSKKGNAAEGCSIVMFSSMAAHEGSSGNSIYASAKAAVEGFVTSSAHDFADRGIRINAVVPGDINAGMFMAFLAKLGPEQVAAREAEYPLGFGESNKLAEFIEFLISDRSSWMTGQCYRIDGGHSVHRV